MATNPAPYQIIMASAQVYWAPVGEVPPLVNAATPGGRWLPVADFDDYDDDGVTITHSSKIETVRGAGTTLIRKASRTEEDCMVSFSIMDQALANFRHAVNLNSLTTIPAASGTPGLERMGGLQGVQVQTMALLVRTLSPKSGDPNSFRQIYIPNCYQSGSPKPKYSKGKAAMLELEFTAMQNPYYTSDLDKFFYYEDYTAPAL